MPKTQEELGDVLCKYCPLEESQKGAHCYGGVVTMCEGSHCDDAYEAYLEEGKA